MIADEAIRLDVLCEPEDLFGFAPYRRLRRAMATLVERGDEVGPLTLARGHRLGTTAWLSVGVKALPSASGKYLRAVAGARLQRKAIEIHPSLRATLSTECGLERRG